MPYIKPPKHAEDLAKLYSSDRASKIREYSLEEQYDLYLYFMRAVHPSDRNLKNPIVERGPAAVPFLKGKLKAA